MATDGSEPVEPQRKAFHTWGGSIDFSRIFENLVPTVLVGLAVISANSLVTQKQVEDIKTEVKSLQSQLAAQGDKMTGQNEKLIALQAQVVTYLGQQTQLNASIDARLTYLERAGSRK